MTEATPLRLRDAKIPLSCMESKNLSWQVRFLPKHLFLKRETVPATIMTEDQVLIALHDCYDPEVPCNIVDLGLVYAVSISPDAEAPGAGIPGVPQRCRVHVDLTLTSKGCPAHTQIIAQIEGRLSAFQTISRTTVDLVWQPVWTPARISPAGRKLLGIDEN